MKPDAMWNAESDQARSTMGSAVMQIIAHKAVWLERLAPDTSRPVCESASDPDLADSVLRSCGPDVVAWAAQLGADIAASVTERYPSFVPETRLRPAAESIVLTAILSMLDPKMSVPPITEDAALTVRACARNGVTLDEMLGGIRLGHASMSEAFLVACEGYAPGGQWAGNLRDVSTHLFAFVDRYARMASQIYEFELARFAVTPALNRAAVIRQLTGERDGEGIQPSRSIDEIESSLQYSLRQQQQALVLSPISPAHSNGLISNDLRRVGYEVARTVRARQHLVHVDNEEVWVWLGGLQDCDSAGLTAPKGYVISVGSPQFGEAGFRQTLQYALEVRDLRARVTRSPAVWRYTDVELALLLAADFDRAKSYVAEKLSGLLGTDHPTVDLRCTLKAYLDAHASPNEAARRLHVARNTVSSRVQRASECLNREFSTSTLDLHVALLMVDVFGDAILPGN